MSALSVTASGPAADAIATHVPPLVTSNFASRLFEKDPTLWGPDAEPESRVRLAWVGLPSTSRPLVGEIAALRDHLQGRGLDHVVLCGMGGRPSRPRSSARRQARSWPSSTPPTPTTSAPHWPTGSSGPSSWCP